MEFQKLFNWIWCAKSAPEGLTTIYKTPFKYPSFYATSHLLDVKDTKTFQIEIENFHFKKIEYENYHIGQHEFVIQFDNAIAFPGLINAHDHLEFNLFPPLKTRFHQHYLEWGPDIHNVFRKEIQKVLAIPIQIRFQWGILKNFLNGVTTVVHHGRPFPEIVENDVIDLFQSYVFSHSVSLDPYWKWKLNLIPNKMLN